MRQRRGNWQGLVVGAAVLLTTATAFGQSLETAPDQAGHRTFSLFGHSAPFVGLGQDTDPAISGTADGIQPAGFDCFADQCAPGCDTLSGCGGDKTWVLVAPYLWAPAMKGTIGAGGNTLDVNVTLQDVFEDVIPNLDGAAMIHVEVGKGRTGLLFDTMILQIGKTETGPLGGSAHFETNLTVLEWMGMYRLLGSVPGDPCSSPVKVDLLGGFRYYAVQGDLAVTAPAGPVFDRGQADTWADIVIGARGSVTLTQGLDAFFRADIGGFGIGTSSDPAIGLEAGIDYALGCCPGSSLVLGYKMLDINESKNSGADAFVFDVTLHGPFAALAFRF